MYLYLVSANTGHLLHAAGHLLHAAGPQLHAPHPVTVDHDADTTQGDCIGTHLSPPVAQCHARLDAGDGADQPIERPAATWRRLVGQHMAGYSLADAVAESGDAGGVVAYPDIAGNKLAKNLAYFYAPQMTLAAERVFAGDIAAVRFSCLVDVINQMFRTSKMLRFDDLDNCCFKLFQHFRKTFPACLSSTAPDEGRIH